MNRIPLTDLIIILFLYCTRPTREIQMEPKRRDVHYHHSNGTKSEELNLGARELDAYFAYYTVLNASNCAKPPPILVLGGGPPTPRGDWGVVW